MSRMTSGVAASERVRRGPFSANIVQHVVLVTCGSATTPNSPLRCSELDSAPASSCDLTAAQKARSGPASSALGSGRRARRGAPTKGQHPRRRLHMDTRLCAPFSYLPPAPASSCDLIAAQKARPGPASPALGSGRRARRGAPTKGQLRAGAFMHGHPALRTLSYLHPTPI